MAGFTYHLCPHGSRAFAPQGGAGTSTGFELAPAELTRWGQTLFQGDAWERTTNSAKEANRGENRPYSVPSGTHLIFFLDAHRELQGIERIEPQSLAKQGRHVIDIGGGLSLEVELTNDELFDFGANDGAIHETGGNGAAHTNTR